MQIDTFNEQSETDGSEASLLHLPTAARAFWRLRRWLVLGAFSAGVVGILAGYGFGTRVFESSTLLLYKPVLTEASIDTDVDLSTQLQLVKLPEALAQVREMTGSAASLEGLGGSIRVDRQGRTDLVRISARADDRRAAADIANATRTVFLERQGNQSKNETSRRIEAITGRLESLRTELAAADSSLQQYSQENRIVDLDKEAQWFLEELTAVDLLYEEAVSAGQSNALQRAGIDGVINDLRQAIEEDEESTSLEGLGTLNIKIERLRDAIADDQRQRAMEAELAQRELDLRRARVLVDEGAWDEARLEAAQNAYDRQLAYTRDTDQVATWREDLEVLQSQVIPDEGSSPSEPLLKDVMLRKFDIELEAVIVEQRIEHLATARAKVQARLDSIPLLERGFMARLREVSVREKVLEDLEKDLADAQTQLQSEHVSFQVVAEAVAPIFPLDSNRRILFAVGVVGTLFLVLLGTAGAALLDPRLRSAPEAELRLKLPFVGQIPFLMNPHETLLTDRAVASRLERTARRIRTRAPGSGRVLLVTSAVAGEGATSVARLIGRALGNQDERVLLIETQGDYEAVDLAVLGSRTEPLQKEFETAKAELGRASADLSERVEARLTSRQRVRLRRVRRKIEPLLKPFSRKERDRAETVSLNTDSKGTPIAGTVGARGLLSVARLEADLDEVTEATTRGVLTVHAGGPIPSPALRSAALTAAISEARAAFDVVLINTPAALDSPHALLLSDKVDGVILVVAAEGQTTWKIRSAITEVEDAGTPVIAAVLNRVHSEYMGAA